MWDRWKPGPVVISVLISGSIGLWVTFVVWQVYGVELHPVDVAWNMVLFMSLAGWWTDRMLDH